ncbi:MAG: Lrp/AsnC family transcriptional regulator, partial [Chloroflexota bacterium]
RNFGVFADDATTTNEPAQLDDIDQKVIEELGKDGRLAYADLSKKLGISSATVSRRVAFLLRENIIKIMAIPNPSKLGYPANSFITLRTDRSKVNDICAELSMYREVHLVMTLMNSFDIIVGIHFPTPEVLYDFILKKIAFMDGVLDIETIMRAEIKKSTYVPDVPY